MGFAIGSYDASRTLVIDPVLSYATYFGGSAVDNPNGVTVDAAGYVYMTGYTASTNLPIVGGVTGLPIGGQDVFVAKFTPDLSSLVYAAYIGGGQTDQSNAIAVDASGNAYVTGHTVSSDFPTVSAYQATKAGGTEDAFVFKLNAAGNALVYSTYFGGSGSTDNGIAIAVDAGGTVYVAGATNSANFPTTPGSVDTTYSGGDAFVAKFNPAGTLAYSTFLGGSGSESATGIALDGAGNVVVVGQTASTNFPTTAGAYQSVSGGGADVFVTKLNSSGSALLYSTYLGGSGQDVAFAVALDASGKAYLTGQTSSTDLDVTSGAYQPSIGSPSGTDAFIAIVNPGASGTASLVYSTYLGASGKNEAGLGIAVDGAGRAYVAGYSDSNGGANGFDVFVAQLDPRAAGAADLLYYSFLGSTGQDRANAAAYHNGKFIIAGDTAATSGLATPGAYDTTYNGGTRDSFAAVYTFDVPPAITLSATSLAYVENAGPVAVDASLTVVDADSTTLAGATVQITGNYVLGEDLLAFNNANPWGVSGLWNAATATLTLSGSASVANYQAALRSVTYQDSSERRTTSTRSVSFSASDGTQSGTSVSRQIAVASIDDAPFNTIAGPQAVAEDTALVFSAANANRISVGDIDAGTAAIQITLTATNGKLTLAQTAGLTFVTGNGSGNQTMTFTATIANINAALDGLRFDPTPNFNGMANVQLVTNDQSNTGSGGPFTATSFTTIAATPVNDAPLNSLPGPQATAQNTALVFASGNGNAITVSDVDTGGGPLQVTLTATNGTLTLGSLAGLSSVSGDGTASVVFSGNVSGLNGALNGLAFMPALNYGGPASLQIVTDDLGNSGAGGAATDIDVMAITVSGNVAPTIVTSGGSLVYIEQAAATPIDAALTVADPDTPLLDHAVVHIAANYATGEDVLAFTNQLGITGSWDAATGTLTLSGAASAAAYQTALRTVAYQNASDNPSTASRTISFVANDGIADGAIAMRSIALTAVNDAPSVTVPLLQTSSEDAVLVFSTGNGNQISIGDADAGSTSIQLTLSALNGTMTLAQISGLTVVSGANGSGAMTLAGTVSDLNAALNGLAFVPVANYSGPAHIDIAVNDTGNTGTGGANVTSASVPIALVPVNDAPSGATTIVLTPEDTGYTFAAADFGFSDASDVPSDNLAAVRIATLPLAGTLTDDGVPDAAGQYVAIANINAGKLVFTPDKDVNGAGYASFTFQVSDDGGTSNGGVDLDPTLRSMSIDVLAINDAPLGMDLSITAVENATYTLTTADFPFNDPNDAPANVLLAVQIVTLPSAGTLTLSGVAVSAGQSISAASIAVGNLRFTPAPNAVGLGVSAFSFELRDDGGTANGGVDVEPAPHTITIDVTEVNQAPRGADGAVSAVEDTPYVFAVGDFGFSDPGNSVPNQLLAVKIASIGGPGGLTDNGTAVNAGDTVSATDVAAGKLRFTPAADGSGAAYASLTFQVQDDGGTANGGVDLDATPRTMTVDVTAVDDAPSVAVNAGVVGLAGGSVLIGDTALHVVDIDNTPVQIVYTVTALPSGGTLLLAGAPIALNGTFTQAQLSSGLLQYVNAAATAGTDGFTFSVTDGAGGGLGPISFTIAVAMPATPPTAAQPVPAVQPASPPVAIQALGTAQSEPTPAAFPAASTAASSEAQPASDVAQSPSDEAADGSSANSAAPQDEDSHESAHAASLGSGDESYVRNARSIRPGINAPRGAVRTLAALPQIGSETTLDVALMSVSSTDPQFGQVPAQFSLEAYQATLKNDRWVGELNRMRDAVDGQIQVEHRLVASSVVITGGLSVGYVIWLLRGGLLLSSMLSSLPAWHVIDPMPVLARSGRRADEDAEDDDPLENMFGKAKAIVGVGRETAEQKVVHSKMQPERDLPESHALSEPLSAEVAT